MSGENCNEDGETRFLLNAGKALPEHAESHPECSTFRVLSPLQEAVSIVEGSNRCLLWESYQTQIYISRQKCGYLNDLTARVACTVTGVFNPLNTKRRQLYLKTQFVPRSKHFSSRL